MIQLSETETAAVTEWVAAQLKFVEAGMVRFGSFEAFTAALDSFNTAKGGE